MKLLAVGEIVVYVCVIFFEGEEYELPDTISPPANLEGWLFNFSCGEMIGRK